MHTRKCVRDVTGRRKIIRLGVITSGGPFVNAHKTELMNLARRHEKLQNAEHPLHRIMRIEERPDSLVMKTTDSHLRGIADGIHHVDKGKLDMHDDEEGYFFRASWRRED